MMMSQIINYIYSIMFINVLTIIKIFRSFDKGPFSTFQLSQEKECDWTGIKFSPDGKSILVSTNGSVIRLVDAFQGIPLKTFAVSLLFASLINLII